MGVVGNVFLNRIMSERLIPKDMYFLALTI